MLAGYNALSEARQALISDSAVVPVLAAVMAVCGGATTAAVAAVPAVAGIVTVPNCCVGTAISVTVAIAPWAAAGVTRIESSTLSIPVPFAVNVPFSGLVPAVFNGATMFVTAVTAAFKFAGVAAVVNAALHFVWSAAAVEAQRLTNVAPPG